MSIKSPTLRTLEPSRALVKITVQPTRATIRQNRDIVENLIRNSLGVGGLTIRDDSITFQADGDIQVGGLGTGDVDMDGFGFQFSVGDRMTTLYARNIYSILVNGVEMMPLKISTRQ